MIDFLYLSEISINSNDLVDMLHLCQEYIVPRLKAAIEVVFGENLTMENFADLMMLSRAFEATTLRRNLIDFGKANIKELQRNVVEWDKLTKEDVIDLKK